MPEIFIRCFRNEQGVNEHVFGLVEDITKRKNAEETLRQSHDELRAIYDQIADGIIIGMPRQRVS